MVETKKPDWIRVKGVDWSILEKMKSLTERYKLHTVCEGATCPNMGECFACGTATFMLLGEICTRNCAFCSVKTGQPLPPDPDEPRNVALAARDLGLKPLGEIIEMAGETDQPNGISWVPALSIKKVLSKANVQLDSIKLIEINEAFAAMPLVSTKILADGDKEVWFDLLKRTNVNGGAIAIGHPVGASGLRIMMTMTYELRRRGGGMGVSAICGGLTQGEAVLVDVS